jgi:putative endonuclease
MTGKEGERLAEAFLKKRGYRVVQQNFRCVYGEIDLIAWDGETLVFVEVKSRSSAKFGGPHGAVDFRKQGKMSRVATVFLQANGLDQSPCRFDVVGIVGEAGTVTVDLFQNAFESRLG